MYRLKEEALPFFSKELRTATMEMEAWTETYHVCKDALEEVRPCFITFGHQKGCTNSLAGWDKENGAKFNFTLNFPSLKYKDYDQIYNKGMTRKLMERVQCVVNEWYESREWMEGE